MGRLMRALRKGGQVHVKSLLENPEGKVGRKEERWSWRREVGRRCLFSLQACEKREISLGILRFGWKMGSCQKEREHQLASLPQQTQNLIATRARPSESDRHQLINPVHFRPKTCQSVRTSANHSIQPTSSYGSSPNTCCFHVVCILQRLRNGRSTEQVPSLDNVPLIRSRTVTSIDIPLRPTAPGLPPKSSSSRNEPVS
jgi:hypothetical protein